MLELSIVATITLGPVLPFVVFGAFVLLYMVQARRRGQSVREYLESRNRETFRNLRPRWWVPHVVFALGAWAVVWVESGFKPVLLIALPLVLLWIPLWGRVFSRWYNRH